MVTALQVLVTAVKNAALGPVMVAAPATMEPCEELVKVTVLLVVTLVAIEPKSTVVKEGVNGVILFCTASLALSIPAPQFCLVAQSQESHVEPKDGKAVSEAGELRMVLTWAGVRAGLCALISATAAAACGVAMLVP